MVSANIGAKAIAQISLQKMLQGDPLWKQPLSGECTPMCWENKGPCGQQLQIQPLQSAYGSKTQQTMTHYLTWDLGYFTIKR